MITGGKGVVHLLTLAIAPCLSPSHHLRGKPAILSNGSPGLRSADLLTTVTLDRAKLLGVLS